MRGLVFARQKNKRKGCARHLEQHEQGKVGMSLEHSASESYGLDHSAPDFTLSHL